MRSFSFQKVLYPARLNKEISQFLDFADIIEYLRSSSIYLDEDDDDDEFFCDILDQRMGVKVYFQLGTLETFDTWWEGLEIAQNLCSDFGEWSCIAITLMRHLHYNL